MKKIQGLCKFCTSCTFAICLSSRKRRLFGGAMAFEAISETYIPLLLNFDKLVKEHVDFRITMSMTPPLLNMLDNKLLQDRYIKYLQSHIELAQKRNC